MLFTPSSAGSEAATGAPPRPQPAMLDSAPHGYGSAVPSRHGLTRGVSSSPTISARPGTSFTRPISTKEDLRRLADGSGTPSRSASRRSSSGAFAPPRGCRTTSSTRASRSEVLPAQKLAQTRRARGGAAVPLLRARPRCSAPRGGSPSRFRST